MKIPDNLPVLNHPIEAMKQIIKNITKNQFKPFGTTSPTTKIATIEIIGNPAAYVEIVFDPISMLISVSFFSSVIKSHLIRLSI